MTTDKIAEVWPTAQELGMKDERAAFGLQFGHGLGVGLYESPMISRLHSFDAPVELEVGMVFALETYCPTPDGRSAARIEEEVVVTETGPQILTRFPRRSCSWPARPTCAAPISSRRTAVRTAGRRCSRARPRSPPRRNRTSPPSGKELRWHTGR